MSWNSSRDRLSRFMKRKGFFGWMEIIMIFWWGKTGNDQCPVMKYIFSWLSIGIESQAWENIAVISVYRHMLFSRLFWRSANSGANFIMDRRVNARRRHEDIFTSSNYFRTTGWHWFSSKCRCAYMYAE